MFSCVGGFINLILHCRTTASTDTATLGGFFFSSSALPDMQINTAIRTARDKEKNTEIGCPHPAPSSFWDILEVPVKHIGALEATSARAQQIRTRLWTSLMRSLENRNYFVACWFPLAWSLTNMILNTSFSPVSLALDFPFLTFHLIFPSYTLLL